MTNLYTLSKLYKCHVEDLYVLKQIDFSDLQVRENSPEYGTYRTLVNQLLEGLADIKEGRVQDFEQAMKEIREELEIRTGHNLSPVQKENSFMGMRRLFILRKDLHLSAGKLGAMVAHCAEGYWIWLIKRNLMEQDGKVHVSFDLDREIYDDYLNCRITKTICEAKNLNKLLQAREMALNLGLVENQDFGMINDACLTELTPEWVD